MPRPITPLRERSVQIGISLPTILLEWLDQICFDLEMHTSTGTTKRVSRSQVIREWIIEKGPGLDPSTPPHLIPSPTHQEQPSDA